MTKLLVVLLVVALGLWALLSRGRGTRQRPVRPDPPERAAATPAGPTPAAQDMVRCAHCGVHLPAADAVRAGGRDYCGAEHAAAGPRGP